METQSSLVLEDVILFVTQPHQPAEAGLKLNGTLYVEKGGLRYQYGEQKVLMITTRSVASVGKQGDLRIIIFLNRDDQQNEEPCENQLIYEEGQKQESQPGQQLQLQQESATYQHPTIQSIAQSVLKDQPATMFISDPLALVFDLTAHGLNGTHQLYQMLSEQIKQDDQGYESQYDNDDQFGEMISADDIDENGEIICRQAEDTVQQQQPDQ